MLPSNFELHRTNETGARSPGDHFLSVAVAELKVVIEEASWINRRSFPTFAHVLNREIRKVDCLAGRVFHTRSVRSVGRGRAASVFYRTGESQQSTQEKEQRRRGSHAQQFVSFRTRRKCCPRTRTQRARADGDLSTLRDQFPGVVQHRVIVLATEDNYMTQGRVIDHTGALARRRRLRDA